MKGKLDKIVYEAVKLFWTEGMTVTTSCIFFDKATISVSIVILRTKSKWLTVMQDLFVN
jgi:hypothetical protein